MGRISDKVIVVGASVNINYTDKLFKAEGPNGKLEYKVPEGFDLEIKDKHISVKAIGVQSKFSQSMHGTLRQLIFNIVHGVSIGFEKTLILEGVGYRAQVNNTKLILNIGISYPMEYILPETVKAKVEENVRITFSSCNKQLLGQVVAEIRDFRKPEPYKGIGIRYSDEIIQKKAGKTSRS